MEIPVPLRNPERTLPPDRIGSPSNPPSHAPADDVVSGPYDKNTAVYWALERLRKYSPSGVERAIHPRVTIQRARKVLGNVGVTRVADVTRLDNIGIPNFMTVRPRDAGPGISYYNGKGTTIADAHAGALMEAIERHAGESCDYPVLSGSYSELKTGRSIVRPTDFVVPAVRDYSDDLRMEWVAGFDLIQQRETWVPLNCVVCPYQPTDYSPLFYSSSNGLASGNSRTEAISHALCEVIERDSQAISMAASKIGPLVRGMLKTAQSAEVPQSRERILSTRELPRRAVRLVRMMQAAGVKIILKDLTATAGISTIDCTLIDSKGGDATPHFGGVGTHPDARIAVLRSLTEAAQSRLTFIQGGREDVTHILDRVTAQKRPSKAVEETPTITFGEIPTYQHEFIDDDIRLILERLPQYGLDQAIVFDLTRPDIGIPVVKVVLPFAETWPVFRMHTGRGSLGKRVLAVL